MADEKQEVEKQEAVNEETAADEQEHSAQQSAENDIEANADPSKTGESALKEDVPAEKRENQKRTTKSPGKKIMLWAIAGLLFAAGLTVATVYLNAEQQPAENPAVQPVAKEPAEEEPAAEPTEKVPAEPAGSEEPQQEPIDATQYMETTEMPAEPAVIDGILVANKQHPLPETYAPGENAEARAAFNDMAAAARAEGFELVAFSTYRSFERQKELYDRYVAKDGQEAADRYSARPGFSEHQTGLAFDIGEQGREEHWANATFGETEAGKWVAAHAHEYGFILRYPEGKETTTGYMHESWHFRYVGVPAATEIHEAGVTLEEYLEIHTKPAN